MSTQCKRFLNIYLRFIFHFRKHRSVCHESPLSLSASQYFVLIVSYTYKIGNIAFILSIVLISFYIYKHIRTEARISDCIFKIFISYSISNLCPEYISAALHFIFHTMQTAYRQTTKKKLPSSSEGKETLVVKFFNLH